VAASTILATLLANPHFAFVSLGDTLAMIKRWSHKGLKQFFMSGRTAGISAEHALRLARQLRQLEDSTQAWDMNIPGWDLHQLRGDMAGTWSVKVSANWRLTFRFEGQHAVQVNYLDYH